MNLAYRSECADEWQRLFAGTHCRRTIRQSIDESIAHLSAVSGSIGIYLRDRQRPLVLPERLIRVSLSRSIRCAFQVKRLPAIARR